MLAYSVLEIMLSMGNVFSFLSLLDNSGKTNKYSDQFRVTSALDTERGDCRVCLPLHHATLIRLRGGRV